MMELDVMRARGGNPILCYWSPMVQSITTAVKSEKNLYISTLQVRKPFIKIMLNISYVSLSLPKKNIYMKQSIMLAMSVCLSS